MPLLYNVPRLHQFRLGYCQKYYQHLPTVITKQIQADGSNPGATNYCWLLAPAIASSESIGEIYLGLNEEDAQRSWGTLDRMTDLFALVQEGLTGDQQKILVKNGALMDTKIEAKRPLTLPVLYKTMGLVKVPPTDIYNPNSNTGEQLKSLEAYLEKYGPILLLRPGGFGGHIEAIAGVAKLKNLDDDKVYDCALVSSTQPSDGSNQGKFEPQLLEDFASYAKGDMFAFWRFKTAPKNIVPLDNMWRKVFMSMDVLPIVTHLFRSKKGFVDVS